MALTFWQDVLAVFYPVSNHEERLLLRHFGNVDPFQSEDVISWQQALGCIVPAVTRFSVLLWAFVLAGIGCLLSLLLVVLLPVMGFLVS